jgi:hypothetical protein
MMLGLVCAVGATLAAGAFAADGRIERGATAKAQADETLELVNVEIDRSGMLFADQWQITERSASLETAEYSHAHTWSVPTTIPPGGADATITTSATDKSGGTISAKTSLFGYINVDGSATGVELFANADKNAGRATVTESKTVKLTPRGGGPPFVTVRVQDGPDVRFNYKVVTTPTPPTTKPRPAFGTDLVYTAPPAGRVMGLPSPTLPLGARKVKFHAQLVGAAPAILGVVTPVPSRRALSRQEILDFLGMCMLFGGSDPRFAGLTVTTRAVFHACVKLLVDSFESGAFDSGTSPRAQAAGACRATVVPVRRRGRHPGARTRRRVVQRTRGLLRARCSSDSSGRLELQLSARGKGRTLRGLLGRRVRVGLGRSKPRSGSDGPNPQLVVRWESG